MILTAGGGKLFVIGFGFKKKKQKGKTQPQHRDAASDSFAVVSQSVSQAHSSSLLEE